MTVLVLVPTAILFGRVWQDNSDRLNSTKLEQKGVEYLDALTPLLNSLVEGESSAVQGITAAPESLKGAEAKVADADKRLGADLKTTDRWSSLQPQIDKLPNVKGAQAVQLQEHAKVIDLTLALYEAVRRNSHLNRDPDNDISYLQVAVLFDLPQIVALVNRMGDHAAMYTTATGKTKALLLSQFTQEVDAVQAAVDRLTQDLQAAVEDTSSQSLSGSLVTALDSFRRGVESMNRGANLGADPNIATIAVAQSSLQTALTGLTTVISREMSDLLDNRITALDHRRTEAVVLAGLALLLVLAALVGPAVAGRGGSGAEAVPPPAQPVGENTRDVTGDRRPTPYGGQFDQQAPTAYGEVNPTRRERSGVLR